MGGIEAPPLEEELAAAEAVKQGVIFVLEGANLEVAKVGGRGAGLARLLEPPISACASLCTALNAGCQRLPVPECIYTEAGVWVGLEWGGRGEWGAVGGVAV